MWHWSALYCTHQYRNDKSICIQVLASKLSTNAKFARFKFKDFQVLSSTLSVFEHFQGPWRFLFQIQAFSRISQACYEPCTDISSLPGPQQQTCSSEFAVPTLGQTDKRTPYRFIDPAPHTMRAVLVLLHSFTLWWIHQSRCNCTQHQTTAQTPNYIVLLMLTTYYCLHELNYVRFYVPLDTK